MGNATVLLGDARALALPDRSVDAIVCDPPYELGFMGKRWDASGVAYDPAVWQEAFRVLKPGGHLLAFGGTRTSHRMTTAIEDALFEIRDSILWLYGSGFPKSLDVSKAIDRAAGAERSGGSREWSGGQRSAGILGQNHGTQTRTIYDEAATQDAKQWQGWGTALKPAHEPIVVARKPFRGTVADNVLAHGTGALNVDGCRVAGEPWIAHRATGLGSIKFFTEGEAREIDKAPHAAGRWPSNVVLSHLSDADGGDACASGCVDGCPVAELDGQSGVVAGRIGMTQHSSPTNIYGEHKRTPGSAGGHGVSDSGGASRFFPTFRYQAKAPTKERPKVDGVQHPTVKPLALMRWLVRLVCPPGGTVLDPFAGSGTTVEAAILEGFDVIAVEAHEPYIALIRARVARGGGADERSDAAGLRVHVRR